MSPQTCRLYLISPPTIVSIAAFAKLFDMACTGGDVAALQIRLKDASEAEIEDLSARIVAAVEKACAAKLRA